MIARLGRLVARPIVAGGRRLTDAGFRGGARGNGYWLGVGLVLTAFRLISRLGTRRREVVFSQELQPGQNLDIRHLLEDRKGRPRS